MLSFSELKYKVPVGKDDEKHVLRGITGEARKGEVLAIIGPSGSGKTSLLNALAGRIPLVKSNKKTKRDVAAPLRGSVTFDGEPVKDMSKISSYVMQEDALFGFSTVKETLMFAAQLRLPSSFTDAEKEERVESVIRELGLVDARDTLIGNERMRGVSGGERKRVNIGVELLHNPQLIFVDEPTSGLDSFQALSVMQTLTNLARAGRTVICSIHQPRSSIYNNLDKICVLSGGNLVYIGERAGAEEYFAKLGHPVPKGFNPADHILDIVSVDFRNEDAQKETSARVDELKTKWAQAETSLKLKSIQPAVVAKTLSDSISGQNEKEKGGSFWLAYRLLVSRTWQELTRDKLTLFIKISMNTFFSLLFGIIYWQLSDDQVSLQNRTGILFFMAMNQAFGSAIGISQIIPLQLRTVSRERASGLYSSAAYYLAVTTVVLPLEALPQILFGVVVYFMTNLRPGAVYFFNYVALMILENFVGIGLGMILSASFSSIKMAGDIAPAVVVLFLMFSGYFLNEASIPSWIDWFKYLSFIRYTFMGLCANEFADRPFQCSGGNGTQCFSNGNQWLERLDFQDATVVKSSLYLIGECVAFNILAYIVLVMRKPKFEKIKGESEVGVYIAPLPSQAKTAKVMAPV